MGINFVAVKYFLLKNNAISQGIIFSCIHGLQCPVPAADMDSAGCLGHSGFF
jgi:hypothetical protein